MGPVAFVLIVLGGAWIAICAVEYLFIRSGIYQAMGGLGTAERQAAADEAGKRHQRHVYEVTRRGLPFAGLLVVGGVVVALVG